MSTDTCSRAETPANTTALVVPSAAPRPTRSPGVDRLRGVALVAMLIHHLTQWFTGDAREALPGWPSFAVTDVAAVAFFCAAGASMALLAAGRRRRGVSRTRVAAEIARRYGLLVPIGVGLHWVLWREPLAFGVLEALGVTVVTGAVIAALVPTRLLAAATVVTLVAGVWSERLTEGHHGWLAEDVIGGTFPLVTYLGFVLVGVTAARTGRFDDRRWVAGAAAVAAAALFAMAVAGTVPDRYPGDIPFVVPGLAGTVIVYALAQLHWPPQLAAVDQVLRRASARALGIFVAHYLLFGLLRHVGLTHSLDGRMAVPAAVVVTTSMCLLAPLVPQLPWSPRTGARRAPSAGPPPSPARAR